MQGNLFQINGLTSFAFAFVVSLVLTPVIRTVALRWRIGDKPNGRRIHTRMIPHLGGIALVLGMTAGMAALLLRGHHFPVAGIIAPVIGIVILGLIDDIKNLRAIQKLAVQVVAALALVASGYLFLTGATITDGIPLVSIALTTVFFVGMASAVNLIDGHDGLAAGVAGISALGFAVASYLAGAPAYVAVSLALTGACIGFLVFNFPPGRIFMGDTGSMFLGVMLAIIASGLSMRAPSFTSFAGICLILGVPILDAVLAIVRRLMLHTSVFRADNLHMHHVLNQVGFTPRQTLGILYGLQACLSLLGVAAMRGLVAPLVVGIGLVIVSFVSFIRVMIASRTSAGRVVADIPGNTIPLKQDLQSNLPTQRTSVGR